ncbi:hypothetical protein AVE30378_01061 [Achromobacter veterisilvae]|uniref:Uncharacterized protein n=1 Tax=Achromobacter veterisilvae TaxID=2069367 RepID=A0A446C8X1_9BURK|nr:hypothetical protein [Achromobacter veterisilvae]SSW64359.1 hypothetical protein AVE30378_01061 [Achromobacter veterisilvae]
MTNHPNPNSTAQAAEPQTVLSFDERERILCQFMGEPINHDREMAIAIETAVLSKLRAPVANSMPIRLSAEVLEYLKEGIESATGCEESDVDYDFANELARLMTGPLYTAPVASAPVAGEALAVVYPPDGTESPFTVINLGAGAVRMGPCIHDGRIGALWFGKGGQGMGHEWVLNRQAHPGETIAVVTFANADGLDVMLGELLRCREKYFPDAAPLASAGDARKALGGYQTDSFRVPKTHPAPTAAKDGQQRAGDVSPLLARALDEWHEDDGPVMWWAWCGHEWAGEAPWCGTPHYQDWPGYHTHWTPIAGFPATPSPQSAAIRNSLIAEPSEDGSANG